MILINIYGAQQSIILVKTITVIKLLPLIGIIIFGFSFVKSTNLHWDHAPSLKIFGDTMLVLFFAFAGFETCLGASGEIKNPKRTVPYSIGLAGLIVLIIYMLLQTVVQGVLGQQIALYKEAPLAAVANKIIGPIGATILLLCAAVSCLGNVTLDLLATPRCLFAGANDGMFLEISGKSTLKICDPLYGCDRLWITDLYFFYFRWI